MTISDSTSTAMVGLLNNQGLTLNGTASLLSQLAAAPVISESLAAIAHASSLATNLGYTTLPGVTGTVPKTITNIGNGPGIPFYNTQVTALTNTNNITGFLSNLSQCYGFATLASTYASEMTNSLNLNTLGLASQKNNLAYTTTTGFSLLVNSPVSSNMTLLANDFTATGTLYDISTSANIINLGQPGQIYSALLAANIPGAVNAQQSLVSAGVDMTNLTDALYQATILRALVNINAPSDMQAIFSFFNITIPQQLIPNASIFTQLPNIFIQSANIISVTTFAQMSNDLQSINLSGSYKTFADIATFLNGLIYPPNYNATCTINVSVTPDTLYSLASTMGAGSAKYGTLSITDFFQVIDPIVLKPLVTTMITNLTTLSTTTEGIALITLFNNLAVALIGAQPAIIVSIEAALLSLLQGTDIASQAAHAAQAAWVEIMSMLSISIYAISKSGITLPSSAVSNKTTIMGIAQNLSSFSLDPNKLGTGQLLVDLTTSDVYGAAIQSAINLSTGS